MFGRDVDAEIMAAAKGSSDEICGYVQNGRVVFVPNESETPENSFLIRELPETADAVFHSHPGGPFYPSASDMAQQYATAIPWAIACFDNNRSEVVWFGDGVPTAPLIGRGFRHGVTDCYEAIRDFYKRIHSIDLIHIPRDWSWWDNQCLYEDNFARAGFKSIAPEEMRPGDAFLATIRAKTPNHAGVYIGDGLIYHHTSSRDGYDPYRLSTVEPAARWLPYLHKALRYDNAEIDRTAGQGIWP